MRFDSTGPETHLCAAIGKLNSSSAHLGSVPSGLMLYNLPLLASVSLDEFFFLYPPEQ